MTLIGAERKNPLTFASYAALRDHFRELVYDEDVKVVVIAGEGGNFCSGGDVRDIIGPLTEMDMRGLLRFTRMTGDLVKAIRGCPQPMIAAIDGVCVGAGAMIATASDIRLGTPRAKVAFLFTRVGLSGADMGACAMLPRIIGQGRAAELLFMGRSMGAEEAERWGFFNRLADPVEDAAAELAASLARGPTFAHGMTKTMLDQEWDMSLGAAIEAEAQAQAICMQTKDFERAYHAFIGEGAPCLRWRLSSWPFFEDRHREFAAFAAAHLPEVRRGRRRRALPRAGARARRATAGSRTRWASARRAHAMHRARDARPPRRAGRLRVRDAGARQRADLAVRRRTQRERYLPAVAAGEKIAAFALSEPDAGSDVAAMTTRADGDRLTGTKTWISNGGIADFYVVFARAEEGISAFIVEAGEVEIAERIDVIAPHPLATLVFDDTPAEPLGPPGAGMKIALGRSTSSARPSAPPRWGSRGGRSTRRWRTCARGAVRERDGRAPAVQAKLADMALAIDASALLVYRSAWVKDTTGGRVTREAAMAKLYATESAQRVIDASVQLHRRARGGRRRSGGGLYREIRALRIYEGASEVQQLIIAREVLKEGSAA